MNKLTKIQNKRFERMWESFLGKGWRWENQTIEKSKKHPKSFVKQYLADELARDRKKHKRIYRWLLGYTDFPTRKKGEGVYYWRTQLLKKLKNHDNKLRKSC